MNNNPLKRVIKLSAAWCAPCKVYAKTFEKVKEMEEYKNVTFEEIDIENDDNADIIVEKYQIQSVPTTLMLDENDEIIYKLMGNVPLKDLIETINKALSERS